MPVGTAQPGPDAIAALYDAALDDARWPDFSRLIGNAAGIEDVAVWLTKDGLLTDFSVVETWRDLQGAYVTHFSKIDPWAASIARATPGRVMLGYEHLPEDKLIKTEFYNDFARPGGMFRPMGARLALAPRIYATIGSDLPAAKRLFEEHDKPRLQRLLPYIRSALQLRLRAGRGLRRFGPILDALAFGALICDAGARVLFANDEAEALARGGAGIVLGRGGMLGTPFPGETLRLRALIHGAAKRGPGGGMRLTARDGTVGLFALVTPLPAVLGGESDSRALVAIRRPGGPVPLREKLLVDLFGLSRRQAAIAIAVCQGDTPAMIAQERGVRISTVRTQLLDIFARTGTRDQRGLVRLIGTLPPLRMTEQL